MVCRQFFNYCPGHLYSVMYRPISLWSFTRKKTIFCFDFISFTIILAKFHSWNLIQGEIFQKNWSFRNISSSVQKVSRNASRLLRRTDLIHTECARDGDLQPQNFWASSKSHVATTWLWMQFCSNYIVFSNQGKYYEIEMHCDKQNVATWFFDEPIIFQFNIFVWKHWPSG